MAVRSFLCPPVYLGMLGRHWREKIVVLAVLFHCIFSVESRVTHKVIEMVFSCERLMSGGDVTAFPLYML